MKLSIIPITVLTAILALPAAAEQLVMPVSLEGDDGISRIGSVQGQTVHIITELPDPGITQPVYAIRGMVRYEDVAGEGYLQLDSDFGDRGTYFTKSLAEAGPLQKLSGSSDWRPFILPFYADTGDPGTTAPLAESLTLSLVLPGTGTVYLRDVALYQYAEGEDPMAQATSFPGMRTAMLVGAIGGTLVGIWGGLIGLLASRGKARGFAIASANIMLIAGTVILAMGTYAFMSGQPYAAWYPLTMLGVIIVVVVGIMRRVLPRRYASVELQKMQSMDL